ncbi:hypothetical protein [Ferrovibrio sp.]|uniref:hypothetical protein n=1 Tax=Ferrovibrio sp. TaxID=1917215 RepID=UPI003D0B52F3
MTTVFRLLRRYLLALALLLVNLSLAAALLMASGKVDVPIAEPISPMPMGGPVVVSPRQPWPAERLAVITERPLFNLERRSVAAIVVAPPIVVSPQKPAPPPFPVIEVLGLAQSSKVAVAVLRLVNEGRVIMLKEGEALQDWVVAAIDADRLRFERDGEQRDFRLPKPASLSGIQMHGSVTAPRP